MSEIRLLAERDIQDLLALSRQAAWNQTEHDWRRLLELEPEGCFGIEREGRIVASTTVTCYGGELAWIGMVLTDRAHRGNGYAGRLMRHALECLERRGVAWIKLDATEMGRPIYARLGFEDECVVERWKRPAARWTIPSVRAGRYTPHYELDTEAFGCARLSLLDSLARAGAAAVDGEGYAMQRPGAVAPYFGPCVARSGNAAEMLLLGVLYEHRSSDIFWDVLAGNQDAVRLARKYGFEPVRRLVRMAKRGREGAAPVQPSDSLVYAIAGFEYG
jgi:GNAT superfamily N-acetyltransferase